MLKLLIVDDERLVRELIKRCVNWQELGFEIVGTAEDAQEALPLVRELRPDVLMTDVRMPGSTGLDLGREVLRDYPDTKVIVVSGYDEFAYVKEGLDIGIFDYILKPIAADVLKDVAVRVREAIEQERAQREEYQHLKQEFEQNYEVIRERQLERLLHDGDPDSVAENLKFFDIYLQEGCYQTAVIECQNDEEINQTEDVLASMLVYDEARKYLEGKEHIFCFERRTHRIVVINNDGEIDFTRLCDDLLRKLTGVTSKSIRIGLGERYEKINQLSISYSEAKQALKYSFFTDPGKACHYSDILVNVNRDPSILEEAKNKFGYYLRQGMMQEALTTVDTIFDSLRSAEVPRDRIQFIGLDLLMEVFAFAYEMKLKNPEEEYQNRCISALFRLDSMERIRNFVGNLVRELFSLIQEQNKSRSSVNIVTQVEDYIVKEYTDEDLSLSKISSLFYVNPNYLSRVFKEKTGKTFRQYLLDLRMDQALVLLRSTQLKAYEVAEKVGIKDPGYFSLCFKKKYGKSVKEMLK